MPAVNNRSETIKIAASNDQEKRFRIIHDMVLIMIAGGTMSDNEKSLIGDIAYQFGFDPDKSINYLINNILNRAE